MANICDTGKVTFNLEVPYQLLETGGGDTKPLIVYLHGYKQNLEYFKKECADLFSIKAYHLFIQGPYPIYDEKHRREVAQWGRAWYLYDGNQGQFISSMEKSSVFIESVLKKIEAKIDYNRSALLGYSMGGYLAGYFALSRPHLLNDLIIIGGRIKTEHFSEQEYPYLNVLALHGVNDTSVMDSRARDSCKKLEQLGARVTYKNLEEGHRLNKSYIDYTAQWLKSMGYKI